MWKLFAASLFSLHCAVASGQILSGLDDCSKIKELNLPSAEALGSVCSTDKGKLGGELVDRIRSAFPNACLASKSVDIGGKGYLCFKLNGRTTSGIDCLRSSSSSEIEEYMAHAHDTFKLQTSEYLSRVAKCSYTSGNTAASSRNLAPYSGLLLGKHQFGFAVGYGAKQGEIIGSQTYWMSDPSLAGSAPFLEILHFREAGISALDYSRERKARSVQAGKWILTDGDRSVNQALATGLRVEGVESFIRVDSVDVLRITDFDNIDDTYRADALEKWRDAGTDQLHDMELEESKDAFGIDIFETIEPIIRERLYAAVPYGLRSDFKWGQGFGGSVYVDQSIHACTEGGEGVIAVYVMSTPQATARSDFGSLMVSSVGLGNCASSSTGRAHVEKLLRLTMIDIRKSIGGTP